MAAKRKRSFRIVWLSILLVCVFGAAGALTYYVIGSKQAPPKPAEESAPLVTVTPSVKPVDDSRSITIYVPRVSHNRFYLAPAVRKTSAKGDIIDVAMRVLLGTTVETGESGKLIPPGTRLLRPIKVQKGVATVDLSRQFVDNFSGGSTQESLTLNSIVFTLVNNSETAVKSVQILVEGKTVESLSGHFELTDPIEPDPAMLTPGSRD